MKKILLTAVLAASASFAMAQETQNSEVLTNRNGVAILPTAGTWAIGVDATPFLNFAGRVIGNVAANSPIFGQDFGIHGRYFLTDNTVIRFGTNLGFSSLREVDFVPEAGRPADSDAEVRNIMRETSSTIMFTAGLERRIGGQSRLQGFYGAELGFGFMTRDNTRWIWGNDFSADYNWGTNSSRNLRSSNGLDFSIGAGVFVGVEYFIAPRISLGGQIGWGFNWMIEGRGSLETETWTGTAVETTTVDNSWRDSFFGVGHSAHSGITLTFHF